MAQPALTVRANYPRLKPFEDLLISYAPASYWRLGEAGGTITYDRVGGNHGTYTGGVTLGTASLLAQDADTAATFNGTTGYVTVPDATSLDVADTFTIVALIDRAAVGTKHYICQKGTASFGLYVSAANALTLEKVGTADIVASTTTIDAAKHFIAATKSGSTVKLYIDGIEVTGTVTNQTCAGTAIAFEIGRSAVPGNYFSGILDEVALFSTALTATQIAALQSVYANGELGGAICDISNRVQSFSIRNGRNRGLSREQAGMLTLTTKNNDHYFTPERNLAPNPSMAFGLHDLVSTALASVTVAATDLLWVADPPAGAGSYAGRASLSSTLNSGIYFAIEGFFPSGSTLTIETKLKSISGTTSVEVGLVSRGTVANIAASGSTITGSYATYNTTLTMTADRTDIAGFIRTRAAAAAVVGFGAIQVNRGSTANTYLEAPSWPMLQPGALIHVYGTESAVDYPQFTGHIETNAPLPRNYRNEITALDAANDLAVDVDLSTVAGTHYSIRQHLIDRAIARLGGATQNLCLNGSLETDGQQWSLQNGAARSNAAASQGSWSLKIPGNGTALYTSPSFIPLVAGRYYTLALDTRLVAGADSLRVYFGDVFTLNGYASMTTGSGSAPTLTGTFQRLAITWLHAGTTNAGSISLACTSGDAAAGVYVDGVSITEGLTAPAYVDYGSPSGRLRNWAAPGGSTEAAPLFEQGWGNRCVNPEAVTNTTGWTTWAGPYIDTLDFNGAATEVLSNWSDTDSQSYTTASYTYTNARLYLLWIVTEHATNAQTCTVAGGGLTWVSIATIQYAGTTRRLTLFRARVAAGATSGALTITVAGTVNIGCGWALWQVAGTDSTGTNGSGAIAQSQTASGSATTALAVTLGSPAGNGGNMVFAGFATDTSTTITPSATGGMTAGPRRSGTAPAGTLGIQFSDFAVLGAAATAGASSNFAGISVEIKGMAGGTLTRVTTGGYAGGFATAFNLAGVRGHSASYPITGTFISGHTYSFSLWADTLPAGAYKMAALSLSGDIAQVGISGPLVHGTGARISVTFTPTANRTNGVLVLKTLDTLPNALVWSGVFIKPGALIGYVRSGITSPATMDEATSITSVAAGVSHSHCTQIVTQAVAGSGAILRTTALQPYTGAQITGVVWMKAASGTPTVALGLANPWGTGGIDQTSTTWTISTTLRPYWVRWTPARNDFVAGNVAVLYLMTTAASAITITVDDIAVTLGTATQPYLPSQAAGIDTADVDLVGPLTLSAVDAWSSLSDMCVSMARMWIEPLMTRPWWQFTTRARQSLATQAVVDTYTSDVADLPGLRTDRAATVQEVRVTCRNPGITPLTGIAASNPAVVRAVAVTADADRIGAHRLGIIDGTTWVNAPIGTDTSAQTIADLTLSRGRVARAIPTIWITHSTHSVLSRMPDDRIATTLARALLASMSYSILNRSVEATVDDEAIWKGAYELEEFIPS